MKNKLKTLVINGLVSALSLLPLLANATTEIPFDNPGITISMDFQDASLKDLLKIFSIQSGLNFIASESVENRKITLFFDKVPIKDAMDTLFKANNLDYDMDKDKTIFIVKDMGKPAVETLTKVFYLKYASVSTSNLLKDKYDISAYQDDTGTTTGTSGTSNSTTTGTTTSGTSSSGNAPSLAADSGISFVVKKLLSKDGTLVEDYRTNSLIVNDIPVRMPIIAAAIAAVDVPTTQILIEVEMLDVSKNTVDTIGFKFGQTPFKVAITGSSGAIGFPFKSWAKSFITDSNRGTLHINSSDPTYGNTYTAQLDWLRTQTDTKSLARPRILTLNNETAEIKIATKESIGVTTTTTATAGTTDSAPERYDTGVTMRVTPQVNTETGDITMFLYPKVTSASAGNSITSNDATFTFRDPEERSTKSVVRVKDGETIVLGGLIRRDDTKVITKLPILGDLPLVGGLFRHKNESPNKDRELLVFITPHIVKDSTMELAQAKKVTLPVREQSTASGFDRQQAIRSSLDVLEKK